MATDECHEYGSDCLIPPFHIHDLSSVKSADNLPMKPRIFLSPPHMGGDELRLVQQAFESNYIAPLGPMVDAFEREFAEKVGIAHAVAVSSGTAAMHLALDLLGVGEQRAERGKGQRSEVSTEAKRRSHCFYTDFHR